MLTDVSIHAPGLLSWSSGMVLRRAASPVTLTVVQVGIGNKQTRITLAVLIATAIIITTFLIIAIKCVRP